MLVKMIDAGMNVARLNFSHGDHKSHGQSVLNLREALKQRPDKTVALMLDTKGPEIRTGLLKDKSCTFTAGQSLEICTDPNIEGDSTRISCTYKGLPNTVSIGSTIFIADGSVTCEVTEIMDVSTLILPGFSALFHSLRGFLVKSQLSQYQMFPHSSELKI